MSKKLLAGVLDNPPENTEEIGPSEPLMGRDETKTAVHLYDYQKAWMNDHSRFKAGMWARQTGKSFASAAEIVLDCRKKTGTKWVCISSGQRQVTEFMEKIILHAEVTGLVLDWAEEQYNYRDADGNLDTYKVLEARLRNGSKILGIPANPDTARGYTANVYFDEFSVVKNSREMWAAIFPTISREGLRLILTFTPKGKQNKAYDSWQNPAFSKHKVDIYKAVAEGCPQNIEELKSGIDDPDLWAQEYELEFLDEATAFLTYDLINTCESDKAAIPALFESGQCYAGMDIARRRNYTIITALELCGDVLWTREMVLMHKASFSEQDAELDRIIKVYNPVRVCIDQTGMGEKYVEDAQTRHGSYKVEGVLFSNAVKLDLANGLRRRFEDRQIRIPHDRDLRDDLHSVKKTTTAAGNVRFDVEATDRYAHADRFWSLALASHAQGFAVPGIDVGSDSVDIDPGIAEEMMIQAGPPGRIVAQGGVLRRWRQ